MGFSEDYKALVDRSSPTIDQKNANLVSAFEQYNIEGEPSNYLLELHLGGLIHETLKCNENCDINKMQRVKNELLLEHFFSGVSIKPYLDTLDFIATVMTLNSFIVPINNIKKWKKAISISLDCNLILKKFKDENQLMNDFKRQYNVARSGKFFQKAGFDVKLNEGRLSIQNSALMKVSNDIEMYIKLIGGKRFCNLLFKYLHENQFYDIFLERFFLNRKVAYGRNDPLPPFGYLLNLAAKYTYYNITINSPNLINYLFNSIMDKSSFLLASYDVQPYASDQLNFWGIDNAIDMIREIALFDSSFSLVQLNPSYVTRILSGLFNYFDEKMIEKSLGFNIEKVNNIIQKILDISNEGITTFKVDQLILKEDDFTEVEKILDFMSISGNFVNRNFHLPTDKPDFMFKPLIKNGDEYVLLNSSFCAPSFYESIMSKLREKHKNLDDKIGLALENYVKKELSIKNIEYYCGKYKIGKKRMQCDIVIESKNTIFFVEIKKKAITRDARAGNEIKLILDLSKSFLDAHLQTGQHEIFIRENGYLKFESGKKIYLEDRSIERIALTLLDYGGFQDRVILDELFKIILTTDFHVDNKEYESDFDEIKTKFDKLRKQGQIISQYDNFYKGAPFHNCWFLSLPQFLMVIDDSVDNNSFFQNLRSIKFTTTGSLDYYYDYTKLNSWFEIESY